MWKARVPTVHLHEKSDGTLPGQPARRRCTTPPTWPSYWGKQPTWTEDGMGQEACRDYHHLEFGFAGIANTAETALIQGIDLYALEEPRILAGLEFNLQVHGRRSRFPPPCAEAR